VAGSTSLVRDCLPGDAETGAADADSDADAIAVDGEAIGRSADAVRACCPADTTQPASVIATPVQTAAITSGREGGDGLLLVIKSLLCRQADLPDGRRAKP